MFLKLLLLICCAAFCHGQEEQRSVWQIFRDFIWGTKDAIDYEQVNSKINEKIQPVVERIDQLERSEEKSMEKLMLDFAEIMPSVMLNKLGLCDIDYNNSCFWAIAHGDEDMTYSEAEAFCNVRGGWVADIYDAKHYEDVYLYLQEKLTYRRDYCDFWLGMTYDPEAQNASTRDGDEAFLRWYPGYPSSASSHRRIYLGVRRDVNSNECGMINHPTAPGSLNGVLCEIRK